MKDKNLWSVDKYSVLIPYRDLEKLMNLANDVEYIKEQNKRLEDQYVAIKGMFAECLDKIAEIRDFVGDS